MPWSFRDEKDGLVDESNERNGVIKLVLFLPDLAMSLGNLGNQLDSLGRNEEALKTTQEAVDIYRSLSEIRPDMFRRLGTLWV